MFPSAFGNDPLFMDPFEHMDRMMSSFSSPFMASPFMMHRPGGMLQLENGLAAGIPRHHRRSPHDFPLSPFGMLGSMGGMQSIMGDMQRNMMSLSSFPSMGAGGHSFQSSTVIMHDDGSGPRVIQSSSSARIGPDGVKETRKSHKDSGTGEMRMSIGHHIHDRAHVIEKAENKRTGDQEEKQEYINIDEDEAESFNSEWMQKMSAAAPRHHHRSVAYHYPGGERSRHEPYSRHHPHSAHHRQRGHRPQTAITYHPRTEDAVTHTKDRPGSSRPQPNN